MGCSRTMQSATINWATVVQKSPEIRLLRNLVYYESPKGDIKELSGEHLTYCEYQDSFASSIIRHALALLMAPCGR